MWTVSRAQKGIVLEHTNTPSCLSTSKSLREIDQELDIVEDEDNARPRQPSKARDTRAFEADLSSLSSE